MVSSYHKLQGFKWILMDLSGWKAQPREYMMYVSLVNFTHLLSDIDSWAEGYSRRFER